MAVPVLRYSFGITISHQEELQKLDRKMRKLLNIHGQSPKGRCRSLVCSQKTGRKGSDVDRSSLRSRNYKTGGRAGQQRRYAKTDCQNARTQHQLSNVTGSLDDSSQNYIEEQDK